MKKLTPLEVIERNRKLRAEAYKRKKEKLKVQEACNKNIKVQKFNSEQVNPINSVRTIQPIVTSEKFPIGMSYHNRKWLKIRKRLYNETVWKGWREADGENYDVITYKKEYV